MSLLLTLKERLRFADWLEQEAVTGKEIVRQLEKLGVAGKVISEREQREIDAMLVIANKLRNTEGFTITR